MLFLAWLGPLVIGVCGIIELWGFDGFGVYTLYVGVNATSPFIRLELDCGVDIDNLFWKGSIGPLIPSLNGVGVFGIFSKLE